MTEEERQTLRAGLRIVARLIARRHLALKAAEAADPENEEVSATQERAVGDVER